MNKNILKQYDQENTIEVGLDEAGRGCLAGPVVSASVAATSGHGAEPLQAATA